jgi:RimJ/RimL family protein N-acetyltransferase
MTPRLAISEDVPAIAALHVQAWEETYPGLVPPSEFERRNLDQRLAVWGQVIAAGKPLSYIPDVGFAYIGPQRDTDMQATFPRELYSFYTLEHAHGAGAAQALLQHAIGPGFQPFTASVLKGNARATAFYEKIGGQRLRETPEDLDGWHLTNILFGWLYGVQLHD